MIDFKAIKGVEIPEGKVTGIKIANNIVWKPQEEYTFIEYIQFNADRVYDTRFICNQNTKIEITFTRESAEAMYLYGVRNSGNTASVTAYISSSGSWRFGNKYKNYTLTNNDTHTATVDKSGITMDGVKASIGTVSDFTANATLVIGSTRATSGAMGNPQFVGKIYTVKIYDNESLALDLIPCKNSNGDIGFYDNITKSFIEREVA